MMDGIGVFVNARRTAIVPALALALVSASVWGQAASQPATGLLPAEERLVYERSMGDKRDRVEMSTRLVRDKDGERYEVKAGYPEQDILLELEPLTLFASYADITSRGAEATVRRVVTVLETKGERKPDEILVATFDSLIHTLRAFPWGTRQKAYIAFANSGGAGGNYRFEFTVAGKETIKVGDRPVECWKAQLALSGFIGTFVGKTSLWYSTGAPHYLVRYEGAMGGPGSPATSFRLESYESSEAAP
jgi:hypothetical protein